MRNELILAAAYLVAAAFWLWLNLKSPRSATLRALSFFGMLVCSRMAMVMLALVTKRVL